MTRYVNHCLAGGVIYANPVDEVTGCPFIHQWVAIRRASFWEMLTRRYRPRAGE